MHSEHMQQVALSLLPGLGPVTVRQLISYCGDANTVFKTGLSKLSTIPGIGTKTAEKIDLDKGLDLAREQLAMADKEKSEIIFIENKRYPNRLLTLDDAPSLIFLKGKPAYTNSRTLGIVGTRRPTKYGADVIREIIKQLSSYRPTIISGLAYGIDIQAHREAVRLGLPTIGVLGSGLDHIYPEAHGNTSTKMLERGCLLTEFPFGTKPEAYNFPARNRIIAGLSDALVVIEARRKGGALITANFAVKYGKACFAVPGPIDSPSSFGCNDLIKEQKATILTAGKDIASYLGWKPEKPNFTIKNESQEAKVMQTLSLFSEGLHIDKLCRQTQIPISKMGVILLKLEIEGIIKLMPGKKFVLEGK